MKRSLDRVLLCGQGESFTTPEGILIERYSKERCLPSAPSECDSQVPEEISKMAAVAACFRVRLNRLNRRGLASRNRILQLISAVKSQLLILVLAGQSLAQSSKEIRHDSLIVADKPQGVML
jgi:hypothetical protein